MIIDVLDNAPRYYPLHAGFPAAFDFLRQEHLAQLPSRTFAIDGKRLYAIVLRQKPGRNCPVVLEWHRRYIDIHYCIEGWGEMGFKPRDTCRRPAGQFHARKDYGLYADAPDAWFVHRPGQFIVCFPWDAHAPLAPKEFQHKVVVKIALV